MENSKDLRLVFSASGIVLLVLYRLGKASIRELRNASGLNESSLRYSLNRLMALGLVKEFDGNYELTEEGIRLVRKAIEFLEKR